MVSVPTSPSSTCYHLGDFALLVYRVSAFVREFCGSEHRSQGHRDFRPIDYDPFSVDGSTLPTLPRRRVRRQERNILATRAWRDTGARMHALSGIVQHAVGSMLGNNGTRTEGLRKERVEGERGVCCCG
jgi:hypothetical protein